MGVFVCREDHRNLDRNSTAIVFILDRCNGGVLFIFLGSIKYCLFRHQLMYRWQIKCSFNLI